MANHKSAKKRTRRAIMRTEINSARRGRMRTAIKKVLSIIATGNQSDAKQALQNAQPEIQRSVTKGVIHKNTAARTISRLSKRIKAMAA